MTLAMQLSGRCSSGAERGKGTRIHAVEGGQWGKALCGAKPGRLSGCGFVEVDRPVNCPRCLRNMDPEVCDVCHDGTRLPNHEDDRVLVNAGHSVAVHCARCGSCLQA